MPNDADGMQEIHILGFSQEKLDQDVARLSHQKAQFNHVANHSSHKIHAHPIVAKIDNNNIIEFNVREAVPKDWIINPETGAVDTTRLPERRFQTPYKDDGITIDEEKFNERAEKAGLNQKQTEQERLLHSAHHIVHATKLVAATEKCLVLRSRDGELRDGAQKYTLPPLGKGHVPVPPPNL
ncbi:MAG: hypothetical protein DI626_04215 [Micavibrio aeruginosavorus]|uniref:Uncharacterized protein n=1 Tax=Micavibrio aeruginosavorus TaxID=349221 RepID=A0A2W4ZYI2_9BACT|nr:MAG: hypothetical protein DI626_04215 [Micavibrio aeruginosavorus]